VIEIAVSGTQCSSGIFARTAEMESAARRALRKSATMDLQISVQNTFA
jgi:hypothetical protein